MNNLIKNYVDKLTKEQIISFALLHNIVLNDEEIDFTYQFIKNNWEKVFSDFDSFNIDSYSKYYTKENFPKIKILFKEYSEKFKPFLN